ncbi:MULTISPECIES: gentisate 1,2-dioxygenase [unclassified Variovorax]|uniref:cupin domain-containing protein n=1 Tax=unclassified Variovorax TaxID=663243 RepID=UPI002578776E|nr:MULTISPECIES: gentisate 1,2-dioxygenase [unclassified Variovorax]MDM0066956.1 gentisate 1,2-dioxygenase [Variovorax sp. J31P207]MDM0084653.1 gentisate 1,2-dioxygenase [Variovorax sp. J31P179]
MNNLRKDFSHAEGVFIDRTGLHAEDRNNYWAPIVITKEQIEAEVERLASLPRPANGRRESLIVHPSAPANAPGLAPGIEVKLQVLKPGERTVAFRHNATEVNFCIRGSGRTEVAGRSVAFRQYDVWNHPSFSSYVHINDGDDLQVRFTYSNAPLLKNMQIYLPEDNPGPASVYGESAEAQADPRRKSPFGMIPLGDEGGMLMPYETLINPTAVESKSLHFPWVDVKAELDKLYALGKDYIGRRLYMMYNPMTGRFNGITPNFFATMTIRPPKIVDRPHRHVSAAINYYFHGTGFSNVAGNRYEWKAGDLMLSAPGWAVHNHASHDVDQVYELTVQDQPLNIYMESLLWQEDMHHPAALLGSQAGFTTNRDKAAA